MKQDFDVSKLEDNNFFREENIIFKISEYLGIQTNNFSEYQALLSSIKKITEIFSNQLKYLHLIIFMDSELVVRQLKGIYKIKSQNLKKIYEDIKQKLNDISKWEIHHIPREKNIIADKLANQSIEKIQKQTSS